METLVCSRGCVALSDVCEGSILKCQQGDMSFSRSLGQMLLAAASTLAFFAAANGQFAPIVSSTPGIWERWFKLVALSLAHPFYAYAYSMLSAFITWCARRKLPSRKGGWGQDINAIILNCPLYIEIPTAYSEIAEAVHVEKSRLAAEAKGGILADVEIPSVSRHATHTAVDSKAQILATLSTGISMDSMKGLQIEGLQTNEETKVILEWMKGLQIESESTIKEWHSAELPAKPDVDHHDDHLEGVGSDPTNDHQPKKRYYIKIKPSPFYSRDVHERFLLLQLELVPEYEQLRFLRSRNTFQAVVTTLQALGYMFSVVQRIVALKGHNEISPLEAILSSFNLLVILQLLLNLYACVHYQRPLLLRLHHRQFSNYFKAHRFPRYKFLRYPFMDSKKSKMFLFMGAFISFLSLTIIQFAFIRYALSYLHHQKCLLCSLSVFVFCLLALSAIILIGILNSKRFRELSSQAKLYLIIRIYSAVINTTSIVLALFATIISWDMFKKPNINMFSWIVPHVSG